MPHTKVGDAPAAHLTILNSILDRTPTLAAQLSAAVWRVQKVQVYIPQLALLKAILDGGAGGGVAIVGAELGGEEYVGAGEDGVSR